MAAHETNIPSDVFGSASASASSSCIQNPFNASEAVNKLVTIAETFTKTEVTTAAPVPCISCMNWKVAGVGVIVTVAEVGGVTGAGAGDNTPLKAPVVFAMGPIHIVVKFTR